MKLFLSVFGLSLLLFTSSCKYEVQFEGPYSDDDVKPTPTYTGLIWIEGGKLFIAHNDLSNIRQIPGPANILRASINNSHDRIAYQTINSNIVIVDTLGTQIETVPNSGTVKWFDWHDNDKTLYMLDGLTLRQHGPAVTVVTTDMAFGFPNAKAGTLVISGVALSVDGGIMQLYQYTDKFDNRVRNGYAIQVSSEKNLSQVGSFENVRIGKQIFNTDLGINQSLVTLTSTQQLVSIGPFGSIFYISRGLSATRAAVSADQRYYAAYIDGKLRITFSDYNYTFETTYTPSQPITSMDW